MAHPSGLYQWSWASGACRCKSALNSGHFLNLTEEGRVQNGYTSRAAPLDHVDVSYPGRRWTVCHRAITAVYHCLYATPRGARAACGGTWKGDTGDARGAKPGAQTPMSF